MIIRDPGDHKDNNIQFYVHQECPLHVDDDFLMPLGGGSSFITILKSGQERHCPVNKFDHDPMHGRNTVIK